jgi:transcriptional repressor NrdR
MRCIYCGKEDAKVIDTTHDARGGIRRRRECLVCQQRFTTYERPIFSTPLVIKKDGTREEFDREKLAGGIRLACVKRPVSASDIDRIVGEVEASLQQMNKPEIDSRVIGDMVISALKELDHIAYIRFAIVYLRFDDLRSIRDEINSLLREG